MVHGLLNWSRPKGGCGRCCIKVGAGYFRRPTRSLLGPLLFTIFINDLPEEVRGEVRVALYADDTKLYKSVTSICDCQSLQTTLGNLNSWSKHLTPLNVNHLLSPVKNPPWFTSTPWTVFNLSASPPKKIWVFIFLSLDFKSG